MMTEYQMKSDTQDEAPVSLTAVAVRKRLLAEPTEAISQILLHVGETADKDVPFRRFDMSEYSDKEANFEFCGSDKVYKNGSAGNVIMFNRMEVNNLVRISQREIQKQIDAIVQKTKIKIEYDEKLPYAILFSEGGNADARTVRGKSCNFFYDEIYELFRLLNSEGNRFDVKSIKSIRFELQSFTDPAISKLFERGSVQTHDKLLRL